MRTVVYGNGKSRLKWDLKQNLHDDIITWGCNRIYNDTVVDNLVAVDYWVQHDIIESGYAHKNKCWFSDWEVLPLEYDVQYLKEQYLAQGCNRFIENDNTNKTGKVVSGRWEPPLQALYITWVDGTELVESIDFPVEWSSGSTAMHLACQQGAKEIYLMGFDLNGYPINNVYEDIQNKFFDDKPHEIYVNRPHWIDQMKTVMKEFRDTQFIWVEPAEETVRFDMNNLTYDTYENVRKNICREH
tara:strand:+ start:101 stop:829 length:729 start_codon:yes stop_codon:yes gene_type:complete